MERLLITGAAGGMGRLVRPRLAGLARILRLSDVTELEAGPGEEFVACDLADGAAVRELVAGCNGVVHLGGISVEGPFDPIREANITGVYNLYEAVRANPCRVLFASSNHVVGYYRQDQRLKGYEPTLPDSLYGVSKVFGEQMALLYWQKFGIETARVRIGSCEDEPSDVRRLATWLSPDDFARLVERVFAVPRLGCPVVWGVSQTSTGWWDNSDAGYLGWEPQDSVEPFRNRFEAPHDPDDPLVKWQGGAFIREPIYK
ncbi:NAD(P)-dependent oxidoreductase [Actibacterium sp. 188UL27-1]|nr:NAD(P)-dependent oxidoreductase [Actibacterium sp. 188UL27-1]